MKSLRPGLVGGWPVRHGLALALCLVSFTASAIVNIEDRRDDGDADGTFGTARLSISGDSGNADHSDVGRD